MSQRSNEALIALRRIQRKIEQSSRRLAENGGVTPSQLKVLQLLSEYPEISVGWIGEQTQLKNATITSLIDKLVERRMVSRRKCDTDRRRVWIRMEPAGKEALDNAPNLLQEKFETRFDELEDWQKSMVVASLQLVSKMLDADKIDATTILDSDLIDAYNHEDSQK